MYIYGFMLYNGNIQDRTTIIICGLREFVVKLMNLVVRVARVFINLIDGFSTGMLG